MLTFKNKKMMIPTKKQEGRSPGNEADDGTNGFEAANTTAEQNVRGRVGGKAQEIPETRDARGRESGRGDKNPRGRVRSPPLFPSGPWTRARSELASGPREAP